MFQFKRIHDPPTPDDGHRVLVDRLWPRGVSKARAALDEWAKAITPSSDLRKAFHAGGMTHDDFARRYHEELDGATAALDALRSLAREGTVTLLSAVKDPSESHVSVLLDVLQSA